MDSLPHEERVLETTTNWEAGPDILQFSLRQIKKMLAKWPHASSDKRGQAFCNKPQQSGVRPAILRFL